MTENYVDFLIITMYIGVLSEMQMTENGPLNINGFYQYNSSSNAFRANQTMSSYVVADVQFRQLIP